MCFFATNSSQFFNLGGIFCAVFSAESIQNFEVSTQTNLLSLSLISSPVVAEIDGIQIPDWSHEKQCPNFSFPSIWLPQLHTILAEPFSLLGRSVQLSAQGFCGDFHCHWTIAQRFDLNLSPSIQTYKKWKPISLSGSAQVSLMLLRLSTDS